MTIKQEKVPGLPNLFLPFVIWQFGIESNIGLSDVDNKFDGNE
jgi:hypothetical protein